MMQVLLRCHEVNLKLGRVEAGVAFTETLAKGFQQLMNTDAADS